MTTVLQDHRQAIFYRNHGFVISVEHSGCFLAILRCLDDIGNIGRQNIRDLRIHFRAKCLGEDGFWMNNIYIHMKLSDQATVVYFRRPKIDWYIFGHPSGKRLDSFKQFVAQVDVLQRQQQVAPQLGSPEYNSNWQAWISTSAMEA